MWKIIISVVCLITATRGNASIESILGEWVPIAVYPDVLKNRQSCAKVTFTRNSGSLQCTDDRKFELIDIKSSDDPKVYTVGVLFVEDVSTGIAPSFNVMCAHEGKRIQVLMVAKLINKDHVFFYQPDYNNFEALSVYIYGRTAPIRAELTTIVNNIAELSGKPISQVCTKD